MAALAVAGCGGGRSDRVATTSIPPSLVAQARPIGRGARFHPPATGRLIGSCRRTLGRRDAVHLELFAADRVVLVATGIGTRGPRRYAGARIIAARCYGALVTLDPTGVVLVAAGIRLTVGDLLRTWGQPLRTRRLLSFTSTGPVRAYVDGRRWTSSAPAAIPLTRHAEIVLEIGPYVPPHRSYTFPASD
jgi:hypothetical protein